MAQAKNLNNRREFVQSGLALYWDWYHHSNFIQQLMETEAWNTKLNFQSPKEWEEWKYEQIGQDHDGYTNWNSLPELMRADQDQLDWDETSLGPS